MQRIVECVPNISDGQNPEIYNTVAKSCEKINGVKLLDVDPGFATNRTVITFAGTPELIVDAAFEVIKTAMEMIDMRTHKGEHARMGATDVCPFVPVSGVTMEECAGLARALGKRVGEELGVWVYLYEEAASKQEWKSLPNIRQGEYESLSSRVGKNEWRPDFGTFDTFDSKFGAVAIGARKFLVAYNINMNSLNKKLAKDIAFNIREKGRAKREHYPEGEIIRNPDGTAVKIPGIFKHCKSTAWIIPEYDCAQITMNLTDIDVTPLHKVYDEVMRQATERGMRVTGSEIVGLVPLQTVLEAGKYFMEKQGLSTGVSERDIVNVAIKSLGLSDVSEFDPEDKIIEYRFKRKDRLVDQTIETFADTLASDAPAPGGGSIAALCGNLGAGLATMVTNLTYGKKEYKEHWDEMLRWGPNGQKLKDFFLHAIDADTDSFNVVMDAMSMPKKTDEQKSARDIAILEANKKATLVPLGVLEKTVEMIPLLQVVVDNGNPNCASDVGVGAFCILTCAEGAAMNVRINLQGIEDNAFRKECMERLERALKEVRACHKSIVEIVDKKLKF
ncbi:MAG: glutamate formimidoyltransferase [Bacteriovoracaceae bacterium]|nr:glutamate formimidoyltransferase [Bacteriovoracaceae bacterium]